MKHYFSFLVLSLSVFLSLVCPSPVMASTVLDFTWTSTDGNNMPADGSFSFSGKVDDAVKSWGDSWVGFGSNVTATSRSTYPLTEGTYVFTLKLKWSNENKDNTEVPKIVINNGSDIEFFHKDENLARDVETDLKYFVTVPSTGNYIIKVVSVTGERDKFGIRSLTIPSNPISCVYSVNNLIMKVITIDNVSTFELSHASNAITAVNNVNPSNLNGGVVKSGDPAAEFQQSGWSIKDGKATKEITWTTLPTGNTISNVHFAATADAVGGIGGDFTNFNISCTNGDEEPSCTKPKHVDITPTGGGDNYGWRYSLGETLRLTATPYSNEGTGNPITSGITGYQWQKYIGSKWQNLTDGGDVSGATSANLQISNLTNSNGGSYRCQISTGATCTTESAGYFVRIFTLYGGYEGGSFSHQPIVWNSEKEGTVTINLNASSTYKFKFTDNDGKWYGNGGTITSDLAPTLDWGFGSTSGDATLTTGGYGTGEYVLTVDITHFDDGESKYVNLRSVVYPKKTTYLQLCSDWKAETAKYAIHYWKGGTNGWTDFMTSDACDGNILSADIPVWATNCIFGRFNSSKESTGNWDNEWNRTGDLTLSSGNDYYYNLSKGNDGKYYGTWGTFSPTTYTITFADNGSDGGSAMSDVEGILCGESRTLVANTWERSGYTFTGWKTNVAISTSAGEIAADGIVPNEATIQNITQDITLTAQWAEEEGCVSRYVIECEDNAYLITPTSATQSCPGEYIKGSDSDYWSGFNGQYIEHKNSAGNVGYTGEMYYLVNLPNTATYSFIVRTATNKNQWINIYGKSGSYNSNYVTYNNVTYKKIQEGVRAGVDNKNHTFVDVNTTTVALDAGTYVIGLYGQDWATWDRFIIITTYNVQYSTGDGGGESISAKNTDTEENIPYNSAVTKCTNVTFTAGVKPGYRVDYWTVNGERYPDADGLSSFSMDISQNVTVKFYTAAEVSYAVTVNRNNNDYGTASADAASYSAGSTVHISATPQPGYRFVNWTTSDPISIADDQSASTTFTMIASAVTVQANFEEATCMSTKTIEAESYIPDWFAYKSGEGISKPTDGDFSGTSYVQFSQETEINYLVSLPAANYKFHIYHGGTGNNKYFNLYELDDSAESDFVTYNGHKYKETNYKGTPLNTGGSRWTDEFVTCNLLANDYIIGLYGNDGSNIIYDKIVIEAYGNVDNNVFCDHVGEYTISELPWDGSQNLTEGTVVSAQAISSCFDTEITFTFTGEGTVEYYDNNNRLNPIGPVTSGRAITLTDDLRAHGIYIRCTDEATLTRVSKTTIGAVYEIWSAEKNSLGAVAVGSWEQQVVLGPEHFQRATEGDVLRVNTFAEGDGAQGALQYIYTEGDDHTYLGLDNATSEGLRDWTLSDEEKDRHYFEITIEATHLANLQHYGVIVKGKAYTIQSVELRASCSNTAMPITPPDITLRGADGSIDLMAQRLVFPDNGFDLGIWEHKLELDEKCFKDVTVGSLINFYMPEQPGTTISFRCNVDSIHAKTYDPNIPRCPSYGDISFDRTIDDLYGDEPKLIGNNNGYRVLSLLVDADMLRRLNETGMIICGKGTFIKAVEAVPNPFVINSGEEKVVPTVVNNLEIYQGGEASNNDDIEVLGNITYFRPAQGGHLNNQLDTWYTFTLPFTVSDVEVRDKGDGTWYDINAVYYKSDGTDQDANKPDGAGHYYLQYLSKQPLATNREEFINRWQYITPGHSLECVSQWDKEDGLRHGYPKKNEAYIILFDSEQPIGPYFQTNTQVRFVGGPQTIEGIAKQWKVPSDGYEYWMYANNTLHSFTLDEAYILNEEGTYFILQSNPTIRPFECYVQATESLKAKYAALPMRGFNIEDNTPTGVESMQGSAIRAEKILRNGQLIIIRNGVEYDATGAVIR